MITCDEIVEETKIVQTNFNKKATSKTQNFYI